MTGPSGARLDPGSDVDERSAASTEDESETFVLFLVDQQAYALPVAHVCKVLPYPQTTRVPTEAPYVLGVFHHAGRVLPLWDLHTLFAADGPPPERPLVVVVETATQRFGVAVQDVDEVVSLHAPDVTEPKGPLRAPIDRIVRGVLTAQEPPRDEEADDDMGLGRSEAPGAAEETRMGPSDDPQVARTRGLATLAHLDPVLLLDPQGLHAMGAGRLWQQDDAEGARDGRR